MVSSMNHERRKNKNFPQSPCAVAGWSSADPSSKATAPWLPRSLPLEREEIGFQTNFSLRFQANLIYFVPQSSLLQVEAGFVLQRSKLAIAIIQLALQASLLLLQGHLNIFTKACHPLQHRPTIFFVTRTSLLSPELCREVLHRCLREAHIKPR